MQLDKQELFDELYSEKIGMDGMAFWASEPKGKYGDLLKLDPNQRLKIWNVFDELSASKEFLSVDGISSLDRIVCTTRKSYP